MKSFLTILSFAAALQAQVKLPPFTKQVLTNGVTLLETYQRTAPTPPFNAPNSFLELLPETLRPTP